MVSLLTYKPTFLEFFASLDIAIHIVYKCIMLLNILQYGPSCCYLSLYDTVSIVLTKRGITIDGL